ncbi:hypothetical protein N7457_000138 [Penicillium paradoxum]|uniref:uncharacterized protein n=1 Tax=Penicillium paradoxum TaxID=176176 RepID=UPI002546917E|nr:uncharacterized protein N7457_000138 [Penicillium paradoxum]KAJ5793539.1 hypothetical protein N7457_000138 [Penicillium paradoxum]
MTSAKIPSVEANQKPHSPSAKSRTSSQSHDFLDSFRARSAAPATADSDKGRFLMAGSNVGIGLASPYESPIGTGNDIRVTPIQQILGATLIPRGAKIAVAMLRDPMSGEKKWNHNMI